MLALPDNSTHILDVAGTRDDRRHDNHLDPPSDVTSCLERN